VHVLILQHPQEPDKDIGTARLAHLALPNSTLKIGLSWANLKSASGIATAQAQKWAVLYLGSGVKTQQVPRHALTSPERPTLVWVDKKGGDLPEGAVLPADIEGIVILDGTWSQAKALWWRNAWLLKLRRAVLKPSRPSLYKELRKEPRRECLSTIESAAEALTALGEKTEIAEELRRVFGALLDRRRQQIAHRGEERPKKNRRPHHARRRQKTR
jgi:DTW domain-containing protein YfiP